MTEDDSRSNVKQPVVLEVSPVLDSFYLISFLQGFIAVFPKTIAPSMDCCILLRESGRHSKSSVKAVAIFLFLAIKSTLITVKIE